MFDYSSLTLAQAETTPKDWGICIFWGRLVAASGLVGVTFTHRLSGEKTSLEDAASDLAAAIGYIPTTRSRLTSKKIGSVWQRIRPQARS